MEKSYPLLSHVYRYPAHAHAHARAHAHAHAHVRFGFPLDTLRYTVYIKDMILLCDVESTGLPQAPTAEALAVAALIIDPVTETAVEAGSWLIRPRWVDTERWGEAEAIHGIPYMQALTEGITREQFAHEWDQTILKYQVTEVLAWNAAFTQEMLDRTGVTLGDWGPCLMHRAWRSLPSRRGERGLRAIAKDQGIYFPPTGKTKVLVDLAYAYALYAKLSTCA